MTSEDLTYERRSRLSNVNSSRISRRRSKTGCSRESKGNGVEGVSVILRGRDVGRLLEINGMICADVFVCDCDKSTILRRWVSWSSSRCSGVNQFVRYRQSSASRWWGKINALRHHKERQANKLKHMRQGKDAYGDRENTLLDHTRNW